MSAIRSIPDDAELAYQWNTFLTELLPRLCLADCLRLLELHLSQKIFLDRMDRIAIDRRVKNIEALEKANRALA